MKCIWIYCAFILFKVHSSHSFKSVCVVLDQFVVLPWVMSGCVAVQWSKVNPIQTTVAECQGKSCSVKEDFHKRFRFTDQMNKENYSLLLNPAKYNDQGTYKCTCGHINKDVILEVIVPIHVTAKESSDITLPCYTDTQTNVNDVTWLHNYSTTVLYYRKEGSTDPGKGYKDRVSMTEGGFGSGDLSLTLTGVQKSDAGLYRCFVQDESTKGYPYAYMIHVNGEKESFKISSGEAMALGIIITPFTVLSIIINWFSLF